MRILSLILCGALLFNSTRSDALGAIGSAISTVVSTVVSALPTVMTVVSAVAGIAQFATSIAIIAGGNNIDQAAAQTALGIFGAISEGAGGFNATGDILVVTKQEMDTLEATKQNLTHIIPNEALKIMVPALNKRAMIQLPKIGNGSRAGQENKIIVQLTTVPRTEKTELQKLQPVVKTATGETPLAPIANAQLAYKVTFYGVMKTDKGDAIELGSIIYPTQPKILYGMVKENGELMILGKVSTMVDGNAKSEAVFSSIPSQFSAQEWQNGTAFETIKAKLAIPGVTAKPIVNASTSMAA